MTITILLLSSNPTDATRLSTDREIHEIEQALRQSKNREQIRFIPRVAVQIEDIQREIRQTKANIVHFSGHGTGDRGLVLENDEGKQVLVSTQAIARTFEHHENQVECVLLNVCNSEPQATEISQHINYVIYTKKQIRDDAAIAFSFGFYAGLGDGESYEEAFESGCNYIQYAIYDNDGDRRRKFIPVFSKEKEAWIELPHHEVLDLATKEPLTVFDDAMPTEINLEEVNTALLSAYINYRELERFIELKLGVNLQDIASDTLPRVQVVFQLIKWSISNGTITDLIAAAYKEKPNNAQIKYIYGKYVV